MSHSQLVLSGMQPTHTLHLGNYLGALKNWVKLQEQMPCLFCVVDMHAITQDVGYGHAADLTRQTREVAAAYIAGGIDPAARPSSTSPRCRNMASWPGFSTVWRGWAGWTA